MSDFCLTPTLYQLYHGENKLISNDDDVRFGLDQHAELDFHSNIGKYRFCLCCNVLSNMSTSQICKQTRKTMCIIDKYGVPKDKVSEMTISDTNLNHNASKYYSFVIFI